MYEIILIIASLLFLVVFSYKEYNVFLLAVIAVIFLSVFASNQSTLFVLNNVFMNKVGQFTASYALLFFLGSILGRIFNDSGLAISLADYLIGKLGKKFVIIVGVGVTSIFTFSGVSLLIVAFIVYPFVDRLCYKLDIPKKFVLPCIVLGACAYTMNLPGSGQLVNIIPTQFLGTTIYAASTMGLISGAIVLFGGLCWLTFRVNRSKKKNNHYSNTPNKNDIHNLENNRKLPSPYIAIFTVIFVIISNLLLINFIFKEGSYFYNHIPNLLLERNKYSVEITLTILIIILLIVLRKHMYSIKSTLSYGINQSAIPILATAAVVGYGDVIIHLDSLQNAADRLINSGMSVYSIVSLISFVLGGVSASAAGGISIAYNYMYSVESLVTLIEISDKAVIHRLTTIGASAFAVLPHHGGIISLIALSKLPYKEVYFDIFMVGCVLPTISLSLILLFI